MIPNGKHHTAVVVLIEDNRVSAISGSSLPWLPCKSPFQDLLFPLQKCILVHAHTYCTGMLTHTIHVVVWFYSPSTVKHVCYSATTTTAAQTWTRTHSHTHTRIFRLALIDILHADTEDRTRDGPVESQCSPIRMICVFPVDINLMILAPFHRKVIVFTFLPSAICSQKL